MCMCECPQIPEESVGSSPAEITDGGEPLFVGAGNGSMGPLEEYQVRVTTEPSLQHLCGPCSSGL